jgi:hypothetical protein
VAGGVEGVGGSVVLAGLPDSRVAVVLAAVVDGHPDPEGQGGLALGDVAVAAEAVATYRARSPLHAVDRIIRPVLLVHGLEDTVVPPSQAQVTAEVLDGRAFGTSFLLSPVRGMGFVVPRASGVRSRLSCPSTLKR